MTLVKNYYEQLQRSAVSLRLQIPECISRAVVNKIDLIQDRSTSVLPESIIYANSIDENRFSSQTDLGRVKLTGWQLQIVKATKKSNHEEVLVAKIIKIGSISTKVAASGRRNGNNPVRHKATKR